jgi:hypothetical protein
MKTNKDTYGRYYLFIFFLFPLVILVACSSQMISIAPTYLPTNTQVPPSATPTIQPFPDLKEWDLLIISDSSNWGVGRYYAKLIEADMGVKVNLHDCWVGGLSIGLALKYLQRGATLRPCLTSWPELVKEAEVMVLFGNPLDSHPSDGSWDIPENFNSCISGGYEGKNLLPGFETYQDQMLKSCAPETWAKYKADIGAVLDEIDKIREGRPLILRMTTSYINLHSRWTKYGVNEGCTTCIGYLSEAIRQVAEEYGVPVADTTVGFNGKDYLADPKEAGYIGGDGVHLSEAGAQFVATLLQQTGYEYAGK